MAYTIFKHNKEYGPRKGLEGPFHYPNGRVAYYDPKAAFDNLMNTPEVMASLKRLSIR